MDLPELRTQAWSVLAARMMPSVAAVSATDLAHPAPFTLKLPVFEGPLDLLLTLIGKHKLDVTEIALAVVTDEFLAYTRSLVAYDLAQTTEFLVVAATLLDLKIARLLPSQDAPDEEDLALLETRDLLFARLLQYRAYKQAAGLLAGMFRAEEQFLWREAPLEPWLAAALPEVVLGVTVDRLAEIAAAALADKEPLLVSVDHVHAPVVSVPEQMERILIRLHPGAPTAFRAITAGCVSVLEVVASFLALLELYRAGRLSFDQAEPLGELQVRLLAPSAHEHLDGTGALADDTTGTTDPASSVSPDLGAF